MSCNDRHIAPVVCQQDALALVYGPACVVRNPLAVSPADASGPIVEGVNLVRHVAKIAESVVSRISIDVVDVLGLFAVNKKPSKAVNVVPLIINRDVPVTGFGFGRLAARYFSCVGVIFNDITHRIRNNFRSHAESPLSVVRGSVVGATDTPILPPFVSSGHKSGDNRMAPCLPIRQPLRAGVY